MNSQIYIKLPEALTISIPYLISLHGQEKIIKYRDENGWSFMHWAFAEANLTLIEELKEYGFTFDIKSENNLIPNSFFKTFNTAKNEENFQNINIHFSSKGYTPFHLIVFLHNFYSKQESNSFKNQQMSVEYKNLLYTLINNNPECLSLKDNGGLTLIDYFFIMKDWILIDEFIEHDTNFSNLSINVEAAYQTLEMCQKFPSKYDQTYNHKLNTILKRMQTIKDYDTLQKSLPKKNTIENKTNTKI